MPIIYDETFDGNKLMSFFDDNKFIVKYKSIWRNIKELKFVGLIVLPVHDYKYIKTKFRMYIKK